MEHAIEFSPALRSRAEAGRALAFNQGTWPKDRTNLHRKALKLITLKLIRRSPRKESLPHGQSRKSVTTTRDHRSDADAV
ncbi:hypothetical protein, partial [Pseudomonas viridiflava]|uniref:hypothetical protein n=1 Tax=Pseudomonas viridiflava TaxID=33069 RepID=UPI00197D0398